MEAEVHQKKLKQKRWLKMLLMQREVAEDTATPDANELQEKFDALVEEN
jgi:hypothetical protein